MRLKEILQETLISQQETKSGIEELQVKTLNDLNDVCVSDPTDGQLLEYDVTDGQWKAAAGGGHGIAEHNDTTVTGAELEELTDSSETVLHSHAPVGGYTNRGNDAGAWDFLYANFTHDSTWRDFDLSSIVPEGATRVRLEVRAMGGAVGDQASFRENGSTSEHAVETVRTIAANVRTIRPVVCVLDGDRIIEYKSNLAGVGTQYLDVGVRGWWT